MCNREIREAAKQKGVKLWQIAHALGITDANFSRKLRREFSEAERARVLSIIDRIAEGV